MERLDIPKTDAELRERLAAFRAKADALAAAPPLPPSNPPDGHEDCHDCGGTGWRQPEPNARYVRCECVVPPDRYADGTPYEFHGARLENYREQDGSKSALAKAKAFLSGTRDLYLCGGVGAGKTRLACSILNEHYLQRKTAFFARVPTILYLLQPGRDAGEVLQLETRLFNTSLLVLDDVGAERDQATDYTRRTLLMIYEERGDRGHRTIWTSNKTPQELGAMQQDDRLASRIAGRADVLQLSTPDQRLLRRVK